MTKPTGHSYKWGVKLSKRCRINQQRIMDTFIPPLASLIALFVSIRVHDNSDSYTAAMLSFIFIWYAVTSIITNTIEALRKWHK